MSKGKNVRGVGLFSEYNVYAVPKRYKVSIALLYPSTYEASITNLFTHITYYFLNENLDNVLVDRFTLDNPCKGAISGISLRKFDLILASMSFELDAIYLVDILVKNRINPLRSKRGTDDPLIIIGGPAVMSNPLPYLEIADYAFIGEGEILLNLLSDSYGLIRSGTKWREDFAEYLRSRSGSMISIEDVKNGYKVRKSFVSNLDDAYIPSYLIRSTKFAPIYGDGYYIEVSRGCKWLCSFCLESHVLYPPRRRSKELIMKKVSEGLRNLRARRVVFYSLSFFDHPDSDNVLRELAEQGIEYSIPSVRYTTLNEERIDLILKGGQRTVTIAPETVEEVPACLIRKEFNEELALRLCTYVLDRGANLKLYFILGLPCESRDVGKRIGNFVKKVLKGAKIKHPEQVRISVNPLIPKANTPMQYFRLISRNDFQRKLRDLINEVKGPYVRIDYYDWRWAYAQALISLGDIGASRLIVEWALAGKGLGALRRAISKLNYDDSYVYRIKDTSEYMPWSMIDLGLGSTIRSVGENIVSSVVRR